MKLGTSRDVEAPIDFVFGQMSDFKAIERAAMRRGAEVQRVDDPDAERAGHDMGCRVSNCAARCREIRLELTEYAPPEGMVLPPAVAVA